jgi:glycosyltransferase involved in cell wall biosynthesis
MTPLLSVGIPAYERPGELERAARSALAQDLGDIEVVVSDDASPDLEVARVGERLAREDPRLRFARQPRNLGHAANYRWVLEHARGEYFMWLSDDDWLDRAYARRCLEALRAGSGGVLVAGLARYHREGEHVVDERPTDLTSTRPAARVARYFWRVNMNGSLFGVARREDLVATPFREVVGGDWLLVAALAARGTVRTLPDVHVHRSLAGLGGDPERLARSFGMRGLLARQHHLWVAGNVLREVGWRDPAYAHLPRRARLAAGTLSAVAVVLRFPGLALLRAAGLGGLEQRAIGWVRERDRVAAR